MKAFSADKPAFPLSRPIDETLPNIGLTKREYFAAMAMQGILSHSANYMADNPQQAASEAIRVADAVLKQLES